MVATASRRYTFEDYLRVEEMSPTVKHEFLDGTIFAMAGGTIEHSRICANVPGLLFMQLRERPCNVHNSDLRVRVRATGLATYPHVTVICGPVEVDPEDSKKCTAPNPIVLIEVLSPSTEVYDRSDKLEHYKQIDSAREIVFVAHDTRRIEVFRRIGSAWKHFEYEEGVAELSSVECALPVADVYLDRSASA